MSYTGGYDRWLAEKKCVSVVTLYRDCQSVFTDHICFCTLSLVRSGKKKFRNTKNSAFHRLY